jgi:hypothetical protein
VPSQVMLLATIRTRLSASSRKVSAFIFLQSIGMLKNTVTIVSTDTSMALLSGFENITIGRGLLAAAAGAAIPAITRNARTEIALTMYLSIIVLFFVDNMTFNSFFTCIR